MIRDSCRFGAMRSCFFFVGAVVFVGMWTLKKNQDAAGSSTWSEAALAPASSQAWGPTALLPGAEGGPGPLGLTRRGERDPVVSPTLRIRSASTNRHAGCERDHYTGRLTCVP